MTSSDIILTQEHQATQRKVLLTKISDRDLEHLIKLARDPDLVKLMGWDTSFELKNSEQFIQALSERALPFSEPSPPLILGIFLGFSSYPIGYVVLKGVNKTLKTAEVGVAVLDNKYRSKGYGKLALHRIIIYAFSILNIELIESTILASNKASINMCKKLGFFIREYMQQAWSMPDGNLVDIVWMELKREQFKKIR